LISNVRSPYYARSAGFVNTFPPLFLEIRVAGFAGDQSANKKAKHPSCRKSNKVVDHGHLPGLSPIPRTVDQLNQVLAATKQFPRSVLFADTVLANVFDCDFSRAVIHGLSHARSGESVNRSNAHVSRITAINAIPLSPVTWANRRLRLPGQLTGKGVPGSHKRFSPAVTVRICTSPSPFVAIRFMLAGRVKRGPAPQSRSPISWSIEDSITPRRGHSASPPLRLAGRANLCGLWHGAA